MNKRLRLFHFSKDDLGEVTMESGRVFDNQDAEFQSEFLKITSDLDSRVQKCFDDKYAKNFRFRGPSVQIVTNVSEIFVNKDNFINSSEEIANRFKGAISRRFHNDFYLIVFTSELDEDEILFVVKMETGTAIQVSDENTLLTLDKVLPDKKSRLQKAAIIFKDKTIQFKNRQEEPGSERDHIHSRVLDRTDENIAGYFLREFLESDNVIDDADSAAKAAIEAIDNVSKPYMKSGVQQKEVKEKLVNFLSQRRETSFEGLVGEISGLLDFNKNGRSTDIETLAEEAYQNAKGRNNTVLSTFTAQLKTPPRTTYVSDGDGKKVQVKYLRSLESQGYVSWSEDATHYVLRIDKQSVTMLER